MTLKHLIFFVKKGYRDLTTPLIYEIHFNDKKRLGYYYFKFSEKDLLRGGSQDFHFDNSGIPLIPTYIDTLEAKLHYYPISIGQYALAVYHSYLEGDSNKLDYFLLLADWFVKNQDENKLWVAQVEEKKYQLPLYWPSAMAQGRAISVLLRAYQETNETKYLKTAEKALDSFEDDYFTVHLKGSKFFEEYPTSPPSFVLNGMIFALWGLFDYIRFNNSQKAISLFKSGIKGLEMKLHLYDLGFWSKYDLRDIEWNQNLLNPATVHYHHIHIGQLKILYKMTGIEIFNEYAKKWQVYSRSRINKIKMYRLKINAIRKR